MIDIAARTVKRKLNDFLRYTNYLQKMSVCIKIFKLYKEEKRGETMASFPKAYATFYKRGEHVFRTEAKLKWGYVDEPIGTLIMLNPGSSKLADEEKWKSFLNNSDNKHPITDEIILDDTMQAVAKILGVIHLDLKGTLVINNIFNLRDSRSEKALSTL